MCAGLPSRFCWPWPVRLCAHPEHIILGGRGLPGCADPGFWSSQNVTNELLRIEPEKAQSAAECEAFVRALPGSGTAPLLTTRVEDINRKYERLVQLLDSAQEKWVAHWQGEAGWGQGATLPNS